MDSQNPVSPGLVTLLPERVRGTDFASSISTISISLSILLIRRHPDLNWG